MKHPHLALALGASLCFAPLAALAAAAPVAGNARAPASTAAPALTGQVLEVKDTDLYTYLRLKTAQGEVWAAVGKAAVKKGAQVVIDGPMTMTNFESKALNRKFDRLVLGSLRPEGATAPALAAAHGNMTKPADVGDVKVAKATGRDAHTVAEIVSQRKALKDRKVVLRGKVVKFTGGVMGKNWLHLRDGTGSAADRTDDIVVTTQETAKVGDVVLAKGVVRVDKDLGAGYVYAVLVEDATLQK